MATNRTTTLGIGASMATLEPNILGHTAHIAHAGCRQQSPITTLVGRSFHASSSQIFFVGIRFFTGVGDVIIEEGDQSI